MTNDDLLTTAQSAIYLGCSTRWIRAHARRGDLDYEQTPYGRLFSRDALDLYDHTKRPIGWQQRRSEMTHDNLLTTAQSARYLRCTTGWIRALARRGDLAYEQTPYGRLFQRDALDLYERTKRPVGWQHEIVTSP